MERIRAPSRCFELLAKEFFELVDYMDVESVTSSASSLSMSVWDCLVSLKSHVAETQSTNGARFVPPCGTFSMSDGPVKEQR